MKKVKIMLGSAAFLVAVVAAFASKNANESSSFVQLYEKDSNGQCIESPCTTAPDAVLCTQTVYFDKNTCQDIVPVSTWRPN